MLEGLSKILGACFASLTPRIICLITDLTSAVTYGRLFPLTRIVLPGAEALISSKGNSFRSFISVSLFKFLVLLTVTIFGSFLAIL